MRYRPVSQRPEAEFSGVLLCERNEFLHRVGRQILPRSKQHRLTGEYGDRTPLRLIVGEVLEQAAVAGVLSVSEGEDASRSQRMVARLNLTAQEGEKTWEGRIDEEGTLCVSRTVQGVEALYKIRMSLLNTAEVRQLDRLRTILQEVFVSVPILTMKDEKYPITGPLALLQLVLDRGRKGLSIQRYKGLGEMNAEQLWETTLDPEVRTLLQVRVEHLDEASEIFSTLMGDVVEPRREFIQENALSVRNLDI